MSKTQKEIYAEWEKKHKNDKYARELENAQDNGCRLTHEEWNYIHPNDAKKPFWKIW